MHPEKLFQLKSDIESLCSDVAVFIRSQLDVVSQDDIESKELNSLVSYVDKEAEKQLVSSLSKFLPEAGFVTEENTIAQESKKLMWVIDPLDGTTNYLYRIPHFSISIALMEEDSVLLGVVYEIMSDTAFTAISSEGAWENGKPIKVSKQTIASEAMVVTGFPYQRNDALDERLAVLKYCIQNYRGIRRLGSAALDLAYVASGRFDIYYENSLNIWDIAAGALLVKEAGGIISDYNGNNSYLNNGSIVVSNAHLHQEILDQITKYLS